MKIHRLIGILLMLINKEKVTAKELSEHFEVSVRTIQRDMDALNMAGIPLYADVGINGGYQLLDNYKLEKGFLNKDEASILFTFLRSLENIAPYSEVKSIYSKFTSLDFDDSKNKKLVIKMNPFDNSEIFQKHLSTISKARDLKQKLTITYYNMDFKESTRIICPYTIVMYGNAWYVYAYCNLRSDFRMFKLHRIIKCELLKESFELIDLPDKLPWDSMLDSKRESEKIVLEIDRKLQGKLPDYFEPNNCEFFDDKIVVTLNFPVDEWVYSLLFSLVPHVKIIKPDYLRKEFVSRLMISTEKNNYDQ